MIRLETISESNLLSSPLPPHKIWPQVLALHQVPHGRRSLGKRTKQLRIFFFFLSKCPREIQPCFKAQVQEEHREVSATASPSIQRHQSSAQLTTPLSSSSVPKAGVLGDKIVFPRAALPGLCQGNITAPATASNSSLKPWEPNPITLLMSSEGLMEPWKCRSEDKQQKLMWPYWGK